MSEKGVWEIYLVVLWRRRRESKKGFLVWGQELRRDSGAQIQQTLSDQLWTLCVRCIVFLCQVKCWLLCSFPSSEYVPKQDMFRYERCAAPYTHTSSLQHKDALQQQARFDYMCGQPDICGDADKHRNPWKMSCRGESKQDWQALEGRRGGMPPPLSWPRVQTFWGREFANFGHKLHARLLGFAANIPLQDGSKKTVPVDWIENIRSGMVEYSGMGW